MSLTKTAVNKLLVAERKSMRQKQKASAFMRKTLNIYNGMVKRAKELGRESEIDFNVEYLRDWLGNVKNCGYCGDTMTVKRLTLDHAMPIARDGRFSANNLRAVCCSCNWQKGALTYSEFTNLVVTLNGFPDSAKADVLRRLTIGGKWSFKS